MVGAFPPPVHGMALVNAAVRAALQRDGVQLTVIDLAGPNLDRSVVARLRRLPRVVRGLVRLAAIRGHRGRSIYMSVSGGMGQVYDLVFCTVARLRGMQVILHHHSFAYLDKPRRLTSCLLWTAGIGSTQITSSLGMTQRLVATYKVGRVCQLSNAVLVAGGMKPIGKPRLRLRTLGFISNISSEKGVFDFLDLLDALRDTGSPLRAKLAGPFQDSQTECMVRGRLPSLPSLEYLGPKYGTQKETFFGEIDALVFPTHYANEAEPLILHEALNVGVPVIAYGRGAIPEILGSDCGSVIDPSEPFVEAALLQINHWLDDSTAFADASRGALRRSGANAANNTRQLRTMLRILMGKAEVNA